MITALIILAGGVGAVARYTVGRAALSLTDRPLGTAVVNVVGAATLGLVVALGSHGDTRQVLAVGLLGGFTTFSTWIVEALVVGSDGKVLRGVTELAVVAAAGWLAYVAAVSV